MQGRQSPKICIPIWGGSFFIRRGVKECQKEIMLRRQVVDRSSEKCDHEGYRRQVRQYSGEQFLP